MKRFPIAILLAALVIMACGSVGDLAEQAQEIQEPAAPANSESEPETGSGGEAPAEAPGAASGEAAYEISNVNFFVDTFNQVHVLGLVTNTGDVLLKFPMLNVDLVDGSGTVLASQTGAPAISEIRPGFSVPFQVPVFSESGEWNDIQISAEFEVADSPPSYQEFELVTYSGELDGSGGYSVSGEIRNSGDRGAEQIVIVTALYAADGSLLGLGLGSPEDYGIASGASSTFSTYTQQIVEGEVDRVELYAEAVFTTE